jgi:hypothetical protein
MKIVQTLTSHWRPKLACLLLATGLWYIIKQNVKQTPEPRAWPDPAAAMETRR